MGQAIWVSTASSGAGTTANSSSLFGGIGGNNTNTSQANAATRGNVETISSVAGTLSNYSVVVSSNSRITNTVYSTAINGTATAQTVTFGSGITGTLQDTTHTASVAQNDALSELVVTSTGGGTIVAVCSAANFSETGNTTICAFVASGGVTFSGTGPITDFNPLAGGSVGSITEVDQQFSNPVAGTASYLQVNVLTNGRSTNTVVTFRINGASGNQTVTFGSGVTGLIKDTTHTDTIAAGDKITAQVALGTGTGNFILTMDGFCEAATSSGQSIAALVRNRPIAAGATSYAVLGGMFNPGATEASVNCAAGTAGTASKLWVRVPTGGNASTTNCTVKLRKNTANGNQVVTVTALTAGDYQDTTNSDTFNATDLLDYQFTGATTGSVTYTSVSMLLATASSSSVALTGNSIAAAQGTVGVKNTLALTGNTSTASEGNLKAGQPLRGNQIATSEGTLAPKLVVALTGNAVTAVQGTIKATPTKALTGNQVTTSEGSLGKTLARALTGNPLIASEGTLTPSTSGNVTVALTGISMTAFQGTLTALAPQIIIDTHDGAKKRKRYDERQKKLIQEERERRERQRQQIIDAFERFVEGKPEVTEAAAEEIVTLIEAKEPEIVRSSIDFGKWIADIDRLESLWAEYLDMDDEEVLVLL